LTQEERGRLERYYGKPDPETKQVKVRWVRIPMACGTRELVKYFWVWDWGRDESPTESQFRYLEAQQIPCRPIDQLTRDRRTKVREEVNGWWDVVHKDPKLSCDGVVAEAAENNPVEAAAEEPVQSERHRRHRRHRR